MKKLLKGTLAFVALMSLGAAKVSAKLMSAEDIENALSFNIGDVKTQEVAYIFGQYVYVNSYTIADSVAASATLNGNAPVLYYKDGAGNWSAIDVSGKESTITDKSSISIEMVKLIGFDKDGDGYVSYSDSLNTNDFVIDKGSHFDGKRVENVFNDETSPVTITSIRKVTPVSLGGTKDADDIHAYNTEAIDVSYSGGKLTLTETSPLIAYSNRLAEAATTKRWIGLLVRTNKPLPEDYTLKIGNQTFTKTKKVNKDGAAAHGGSGNDFIVWVSEETFNAEADKIISLVYNEKTADNKTEQIKQEITVAYNKPISTERVIGATDTVEVLTENANYKTVKVGDTYRALIYSSNTDVKVIDYAVSGNKRRFDSTKSSDYDLIDIKAESFKPGKSEVADTAMDDYKEPHKWNQEAIKFSEPVEAEDSTDANRKYEVTITANKKLKSYQNSNANKEWTSVLFDLGIDPQYVNINNNQVASADRTHVDIHGGVDGVNFVEWFGFNATDTVKTITFENSQDSSDKYVVKFTLKEEIAPFELTNAKIITKNVDLNDETIKENSNDQDRAKVTQFLRENVGRLNDTVKIDTTKNASDKTKIDSYDVTINATDVLSKITDAGITGKITYAKDSKPYAIVLDFGVDRDNIRFVADSNSNAYALGVATIDDAEDTATDAEVNAAKGSLGQYGATGTEFVVVLTDTTEVGDTTAANLVFQNVATNTTVTVTVKLVEAVRYDMSDDSDITGTVTPVTEGVKYEASSKSFIVPENITNFKATVNGKEYTFNCSGLENDEPQCEKEEALKIQNVYIAKDETSEDTKYNQASVKVVSKTEDSVDLNVIRDLNPATDIKLLIDFGKDMSGYEIDGAEPAIASDLPSDVDAANVKNYVVATISYTKDSDITPISITLDSGDVSHIINVTAKQIANDTDIKAVSAHKVTTGVGNKTFNDITVSNDDDEKTKATEAKNNLEYNLEAIQNIEVVDGVIKVYVNKTGFRTLENAVTLPNGGTALTSTGKYIAIAANLNTKVTPNPTEAKDFGADVNNKETLIWIDLTTGGDCKEKSDTCKAYTTGVYTNADTENKHNKATVTIEVITSATKLEKPTMTALDSNEVPAGITGSNIVSYKYNQENYKYSYKYEGGKHIYTINPTSDDADAFSYENTEIATTSKWVGMKLDFGTEVKLTTSASGARKQDLDGTAFILWVNVNYVNNGIEYVFTSTYDDDQNLPITVKYDSTVKSN